MPRFDSRCAGDIQGDSWGTKWASREPSDIGRIGRLGRSGNCYNIAYVDHAKLHDLSIAQRREKDVKKRKAIFDEISRLAAVEQYHIYLVSYPRIASWQPYVMNFNTNLGYDYGGRLLSAWLSKL